MCCMLNYCFEVWVFLHCVPSIQMFQTPRPQSVLYVCALFNLLIHIKVNLYVGRITKQTLTWVEKHARQPTTRPMEDRLSTSSLSMCTVASDRYLGVCAGVGMRFCFFFLHLLQLYCLLLFHFLGVTVNFWGRPLLFLFHSVIGFLCGWHLLGWRGLQGLRGKRHRELKTQYGYSLIYSQLW